MIEINLTQRMMMGICLGIAILFGFTLLYTIWCWYDDWQLAHQANTQSVRVATTDETTNMITAIPDAHLFGQTDSEMPITSLQLRVTGIVKKNDAQTGSVSKAYISISGQPSKIYQTGDDLPYGVKVYEITTDSVILENDGKLEKLPLPRERLEFKPRYQEPM
jgi:type II secretory pathway component PulC